MSGLGSDYTRTPSLGLYKPIANMAVGLWGDLWNANADAIDSAIHFASGGGPFLPLANVGWAIGNVPGPIVNQGGISALHPTAELLFQRAAFAATDGQDFHFRRATAFTGGTSANINKTVLVDTGIGANDTTSNWGFTSKISTASTSATAVGLAAYLQTWRSAGGKSQCWGAVVEMSDFTGLKSSLVVGPTNSMEIDLGTTDIDDATNPSKWGGIGNRHIIHFVVARNQGALLNEASHGLWFGTNGSYIDSLIGADLGVGAAGAMVRQIIDARGFIPPTGVTDPVAAVRMLHDQIIDFNGGPALNSAPGSYLQYTTSGTSRLRYMAGATEAVAISDNGGLSSPSLPTNVLFHGAKMDGTTNDATAFQAATAATPADGTITVPRGGFNVLTAPTRASGNVLWQLDGNKFGTGTTPVVFTGSPGDVTETFVQGRKSFKKQVTNAQSIAVVEVNLDYQWTTAPSNAVSSGVHVICTPGVTTGNTFVWGINSELNSATNGTNQHLAGAFTTRKAGTAPCFALFAQMLDNTGSPSSVSGGAVTCEFDLFANGLDDAPLGARNVLGVIYGRSDRTGSGTDMSVHKALTIGPQPVEVAHASADIMINLYGTFNQSGLDSRPATQGPSANAIWLGDNHTVALNTAGTAKFQYRTATSRLYYSIAGVDMWSVDASGNMRCAGTVTGSTTP